LGIVLNVGGTWHFSELVRFAPQLENISIVLELKHSLLLPFSLADVWIRNLGTEK
jgi:hypothetical protein